MISDQLQECQSKFNGHHQPFDVKFELKSNQTDRALFIELRNKNAPEYFQLSIDRHYIQEQKDLSFCFQTPEDIFYTLTQLFEQLVLESEGSIVFEMKLNASKLKRKLIKIQLNKYELDQHSFIKQKFEQLSMDVKQELHKREIGIKRISQKTQQHHVVVESLTEEIKELKKDQEILSLQNKRQYFKINNLTKQNEQQKQQIFSLKQQLHQTMNKINTMEFFCFYLNPHWHHFGVVKTHNSFKIIRKDLDSCWCSFIYNIPLQRDRVNGFKIRQSKSANKHIMYGIGVQQIFGNNASYKDQLAISYSASSGNLWENGDSKKIGPSINEGQIVTMEINMTTKKMFWEIDNQKIAKTSIPQQLGKKDIYLFLHFYNIGDELDILTF